MKRVFAITAVLALLGLGIATQANVFDLGAGYTNLETVAVGDAGNAADTRYAMPGHGSVGYNYNIGKYEVTAAQYTDFLNHKAKSDPYGLYNTDMSRPAYDPWTPYDPSLEPGGCNIQRSGTEGSYTYSIADDWANRPVNYVSFWDACRFANWLGNGQGDGDTETGAYILHGYNGDDDSAIQRNADANWAVTSEDEWYKAAYYKGGGPDAGYWDYPTQIGEPIDEGFWGPSNVITNPDVGNSANIWRGCYTLDSAYWRTNVGEFENSASAYGTFDQGGNVWERNDTVAFEGYAYRGMRGGSFNDVVVDDYCAEDLRACSGFVALPAWEDLSLGFRVSQVPEPSSIVALAGGLAGLLGIRRRKA